MPSSGLSALTYAFYMRNAAYKKQGAMIGGPLAFNLCFLHVQRRIPKARGSRLAVP
jgi:hypothetical protein